MNEVVDHHVTECHIRQFLNSFSFRNCSNFYGVISDYLDGLENKLPSSCTPFLTIRFKNVGPFTIRQRFPIIKGLFRYIHVMKH